MISSKANASANFWTSWKESSAAAPGRLVLLAGASSMAAAGRLVQLAAGRLLQLAGASSVAAKGLLLQAAGASSSLLLSSWTSAP